MDKVLVFFEKYCQWLAVVLGGLFLTWTLSSYVLFTPVALQANGKTFTPGDVEDAVKVTSADPLERLIKDPEPVQPPKKGTTDIAGEWHQLMDGDVQLAAIPSDWINSRAGDFKIKNDTGPALVAQKITDLPTLPPAEIVDGKSARAFIGPAVPAANAPPVAAPAAAPMDKSYVRVTYDLPSGKIAAAFAAVNIPANITSTSVVGVRLIRQEMLPDGTWSAPVQVPDLKNGVDIEPLPAAGATPTEVTAFRTWAEGTGQMALLRPVFYPVISGEGPWDPPADDLLPKFDPAAERQRQLELLKAKQEADKAKLDAERAKRAAAAPPSAPRGPVPPRAPPRGSGRHGPSAGGGSGAARDRQRPDDLGAVAAEPFAQVRPPSAPIPGMPGGPVIPGTPGGPPMNPAAPPMAAPPAGQGAPPADALPPANFQPAALSGPIVGWGFDDTVLEDHTYRYQVVYTLRNPVYQSNIVADPALSTQFAIESKVDEHAWGQPIKVKPSAELYLASTNWTESRVPSSIKINVFKWAQGKWQMEPFTVSPGDKIGDKQNDVDYDTNATLVDIRYDTRAGQNGRAYVLLLTADGQLIEREPATDLKNPRMFQLRQAVQNPQTPQSPQGQQPGGPPSPVGPPGIG